MLLKAFMPWTITAPRPSILTYTTFNRIKTFRPRSMVVIHNPDQVACNNAYQHLSCDSIPYFRSKYVTLQITDVTAATCMVISL